MGRWEEYSPMVRESKVQSLVESYQRLKKWYLIPPYLTLSIIRYTSRVKWSNSEKEVVPSITPWCSSYWKGSVQVTLNYSRQLYLNIEYLKDPETTYLGFTWWIIRIIQTKESWPKQHFINKVATRKDKKLALKKRKKKNSPNKSTFYLLYIYI